MHTDENGAGVWIVLAADYEPPARGSVETAMVCAWDFQRSVEHRSIARGFARLHVAEGRGGEGEGFSPDTRHKAA